MELLPVFVITLLFSLGLVLALSFGKVPTYRPSRDQVVGLLQAVLDGSASHSQWDLFIGMPIQHDEALEAARVECVILHEGLDGSDPAREGIDGYIYDRAGREKIARILENLQRVIEKAPITREF